MISANQLISEMRRLGVHFIVGDKIPEKRNALSPRKLMAGLIAHEDARIRLALIPILLQHPKYAEDALDVMEYLDQDQEINFKLYYTAAYLLQLAHYDQLQRVLENFQDIPDYFSKELDVRKQGTPQDRLKHLANRHREITKMSMNWYGTYQHAAEGFYSLLVRTSLSELWA